MPSKTAWLLARIDEVAPPAGDLSTAQGVGRSVASLAEAVKALESGAGTVFGLFFAAGDLDDAAALATRGRDVLTAWRARLLDAFGDEGVQTFDTILDRHDLAGFRERAELPTPTANDVALAERLLALLHDPAKIAEAWRAQDRLEEGGVGVELGAPRDDALAALADRYLRAMSTPLPGPYVALWSRANGVAVFQADEDALQVVPRVSSEPQLWPIDTYADHWALEDVFDDGLFVFGGLEDSGTLALRAREGAPADVVWVTEDEVTPIAADLGEFLTAFLASSCSVQPVLRAKHVPGWD